MAEYLIPGHGVIQDSEGGYQYLIPSAGVFNEIIPSGGTTITPTGIASAEAFGTANLVIPQVLLPVGVSSLEALGSHVVLTGGIVLEPTSITSGELLGTPNIIFAQIVSVSGIDSEEAFGVAMIQDGVAVVIPVADRDTYQDIQAYLVSTNMFVSKQNNTIIMEWLRSEGITEGAFNDMFYEYWESNGFVGAYNDKWKKWKDS